jgi:ABC-2 type transport system ATP-binding protein
VISVRNLVFDYPSRRALHGVSFDAAPGSVTALVGPNGAGKTTLLRCLAALEAPTAGTVHVAGLDTLASPRQVHRLLGFLPDFFGLYDDLTVERSLIYAARLRGVSPGDAPAAAARAAARVTLTDRLTARAAELSRGMRQRLAIGMTIVHAPQVLLLDEPAAGLDPDARRSLSDLIRALSADGMTILVSSHILAELEDYSTAMVIVDKGVIAGGGPITHRSAERQRVRIVLEREDPQFATFLQGRGLIARLAQNGVFVEIEAGAAARAALLSALVREGFAVTDFAEAPQTLEETYFAETRGAGGTP